MLFIPEKRFQVIKMATIISIALLLNLVFYGTERLNNPIQRTNQTDYSNQKESCLQSSSRYYLGKSPDMYADLSWINPNLKVQDVQQLNQTPSSTLVEAMDDAQEIQNGIFVHIDTEFIKKWKCSKLRFKFYRRIKGEGAFTKMNTSQGFSYFSDLPEVWYEYKIQVAIKKGAQYLKVTMPEGVIIDNKEELEFHSGLRTAAANEVIIKIQIPGFRLEMVKTGRVYASANPIILVYILLGFFWRNQKRLTSSNPTSGSRINKTERELIAEGELKLALRRLLSRGKRLNAEFVDEITILQSRLSRLFTQQQRGIITQDEYSVGFNQITKATLYLLSKAEE